MQFRLETSGRTVTLNPHPLALGGEAYLYVVNDIESLVAKVYHHPSPEHADKLAVMIGNPPVDPMANIGHPSIAWPQERLFTVEPEPRCVGFVMPRVNNMRSVFEFYNPKTRRQHCPMFHYRYLIRTARNLAAAVHALHSRGYVIGDMNESNILVNEMALVTLVDTDSFQVPTAERTFRCPVGKPEFTPPELQSVRFREIDRKPEHDNFGLAVLVFLLLMEGTHPFAGRLTAGGDPEPLGERIAAHHYPYSSTQACPYEPMPLAPPIGLLYPDVRNLIRLCFEIGHNTPALRPGAASWQQALDVAESNLRLCRKNTQHFYRFSLNSCPWCERTSLLGGWDPFPSRKAVQRGDHRKSFIVREKIPIIRPLTGSPSEALELPPAPWEIDTDTEG